MKAKIVRYALPAAIFALLSLVPELLEFVGLESRALRSELRFLTLVALWSIYALSFNILYGFTGLLSLGHATFLGIGALSAAIAASSLGFGLWASLGIGLFMSTVSAMILGILVVQVKGIRFVVVTAALSLAIYIGVINFAEITGGVSGIRLPRESLQLGFIDRSLLSRDVGYTIALIALGLVYLSLRWFLSTPLGVSFKYIRENESKAAQIGYNVRWIKWVSFSLSGFIAGLAGALITLTQGSMDANLFHWSESINALVWVVVGGIGTILGPMLGVALLQGIEHYATDVLPINSILLSGIVLLLFIRFAPHGLIGIFKKRGSRD